MKTYIHVFLAVLVWNICVCSSYSQQENEDRRIYIKLKELLNRMKQEKLKHEVVKKVNIGKEHIKAIENQHVDPESKYMELFESFQVVKNEKNFKPNDIHPEKSKYVKAEREDSHILTHRQKVELGLESEKPGEDNSKGKGNGKGKGGMKNRAFATNGKLWEKKIVPYKIDQTLNNQDAIGVINQAIAVFDSFTCVQWKPYSTSLAAEVGHDAYINFYSGSGCWSYVGRIKNSGQQLLSLRSPGCVGVGIAIHEMLHALGQWHEQSRADRDDHVSVSWDILGKVPTDGNYGKFHTRNLNPYDYESIMHYSLTNGFVPLQPELGFLTNYGSSLSFYDIADITDAYRCTEQCVDPPDCKNGGFVNSKCNCSCPYGLTGRTCESVINGGVCGGIIDLIPGGQDKTITSPNYPNDYDVDTQCVWLLRAPPGFHVRVDADVFHLPYDNDNNRCFHWMEVRSNLVGQTGIRKCGDTTGEIWVTSQWGEKNLMLLIFDSVFGKDHFPEKGFSLRARTVKDGCMPDPCIYGVCKDCDDQAYKCECDPGFEGQNCEIVDASNTLECSFEKGRKCFMKNVVKDQFDWKVNFGPTVSDLTGPDSAVEGQNYLYAEASSPRQLGDTAVLESDLTFPAEDRCLTFYYNMFGAEIGSLTVNSTSTVLWSKVGNQGLKWNLAKIDIPQTSNLKIVIEAKRGSDWEGDIAIDDIKLAPGLCVSPVQSECLVQYKGQDYTGTKAVTKYGVTCQRWDSNSPHSHNYHAYDGYENYCRNTLGGDAAPWCYTIDLNKRWDLCDIPHCHIEECIRSENGYDYMGNKSTTTKGKTCISGVVCRASGNDPAPWCKTTDQNTYWDTCDISKCTTEPKECLQTAKGVDYFGTVSVTESGIKCQRWDKQTPHQHNYWYLEDQENFCRNPDNSNRPWCFSMDETVGKEYCRIPYCEDLPCESNPCLHGATCNNTGNGGFVCHCRVGYEGVTCDTRTKQEYCKRTADGYDYQGQKNVTIGNRTCQRWELDSPQPHSYNGLPENYCRNPDHEPTPWCYTTDPWKRFELCDVPFCTTPAKECLESEKGAEYFGTVHTTHNGKTCQKWSEQTPHSHSLTYLGDQENFCRNPFGGDARPWCYTTDPGDRWQYCAIPSC